MTLFAVLPFQHARSLRTPTACDDQSYPSSYIQDSMSTNPPPDSADIPPATPLRPPLAVVNSTPYNRGSASRSLRDDSNNITVQPQLVRKDYDNYLLEDLARHRVYISFENGLRNILHVPNDWKSSGHEYQKIISEVREDEDYRKFRAVYLEKCRKHGAIETTLYEPQADLYNQALSKINKFCDEKYRKDEKSLLHFRVNHPKHIRNGIFSARGLDPDLTGIFKPLEKSEAFAWPMIVHTEEMKDSDVALDIGQDAPRVISKGEDDPLCKHHSPSRKTTKNNSDTDTQEIPNQNNKREMTSDISTSNKVSHTSLKTSPSTGDLDNQQTAGARLQCARYLLEMLEFSILRSHTFLTLVDRDHFQLMYADRSSIVTTSIVNLNTSEGEAMFLAMLIAFHRLTPKQWGFLPLVDNSFASEKGGDKSYYRSHISKKYDRLKDLELRLHREKDGDREDFSLKLGTIAYHQPGIIGRGTCVVDARCDDIEEWKQYQELVTKVSWPSIKRQSEVSLLDKAKKKGAELVTMRKAERDVLIGEAEKLRKAGKTVEAEQKTKLALDIVEQGESHWALNHLPNILHSQDFDLHSEEEPMPQRKLAVLFEGARIVNGDFHYEIRALRVTVQEKLYKILLLPTLQTCAQVFYDVLQCHRWLYDYVLILHRDISYGNIMYRKRNDKIYGVLNDLDLSSLRKHVERGSPTSSQRTGTPPYMAIELLQDSQDRGPGIRHMYRHDLESLTYVILILCSRNKFDPKTESLERLPTSPFDRWFDAGMSWNSLSHEKYEYLEKDIDAEKDIHPSFNKFVPWIDTLLSMFQVGFYLKKKSRAQVTARNVLRSSAKNKVKFAFQQALQESGETVLAAEIENQPLFDEETLGKIVRYSLVFDTMSTFGEEELEKRSKDPPIDEDGVMSRV